MLGSDEARGFAVGGLSGGLVLYKCREWPWRRVGEEGFQSRKPFRCFATGIGHVDWSTLCWVNIMAIIVRVIARCSSFVVIRRLVGAVQTHTHTHTHIITLKGS